MDDDLKDLGKLALYIVVTVVIVWLAMSAAGCNGLDINAKIRPSWPAKPDPYDETKPEPPKKPDPYDWEPWWNRPPKGNHHANS